MDVFTEVRGCLDIRHVERILGPAVVKPDPQNGSRLLLLPPKLRTFLLLLMFVMEELLFTLFCILNIKLVEVG